MTTTPHALDMWPQAPAARISRVRVGTLLLAGLFLVVWVASLSRSLFDPPGFDQAQYQYATERILAGQREHALLWSGNGMGIYLPHWLSIVAFGTSPMALRLLDALWQAATLASIVLLGARDDRKWAVGWLAAVLYALVYYGGGYVHTAQREGFAVLPLMLLSHAVLRHADANRPLRSVIAWELLGGAMGFFAFTLKQPLGLCFGVVWLLRVREAWRWRDTGGGAWVAPAALSAGFIGSAVASAVLFVHLGLWSGYADAVRLGDQVPNGYVRGPELVGKLLPYALPAIIVVAVFGWSIAHRRVDGDTSSTRERAVAAGRWATIATVIFVLLWLNHRWPEWQNIAVATAGLMVPALGAVFMSTWSGRSRAWKLCLILALAALLGTALQGWFFAYHMAPVWAFVSYLAAGELLDACRAARSAHPRRRVWSAVCIAGALHLAVSHWGWTMTFYSSSPYVLADASLVDHYTRITRHKPRYPAYATTHRAAGRVQELTGPDEPIVCLFRCPRLYLLARRPPAHPLICVNEWTRPTFPEFLAAIRDVRPKVAVVRIPTSSRGKEDLGAVEEAVFTDLESTFGPAAAFLRATYSLTDVIDDIGLLQPASEHHLSGNEPPQNISPWQKKT